MNISLQQHGPKEVYKQVYCSMRKNGLDKVRVEVSRRAGKVQIGFTGSPEDVAKAEKILAAWD